MTKQEDVLLESAVKSQHETIMQGGKIEQFAEAMGRFCRVEGWKKLKDEDGLKYKSLRHYIEAKPPFGAGYAGKEGMGKIEAYLSLSPVIKDYFQHCHANCLFEMAKEEGVSPNVVAKREWNDVMGAKLARDIQENPEQIYMEKAAAYIEGRERVKQRTKAPDPTSSVRLSYKPNYPVALAKKLKEILSPKDIAGLMVALSDDNLEEDVEFERRFNLALNAFNKSVTENGWGVGGIKAPEELVQKEPLINYSEYIEGEKEGKNLISLRDETTDIVIVRFSATGGGVEALSFER